MLFSTKVMSLIGLPFSVVSTNALARNGVTPITDDYRSQNIFTVPPIVSVIVIIVTWLKQLEQLRATASLKTGLATVTLNRVILVTKY